MWAALVAGPALATLVYWLLIRPSVTVRIEGARLALADLPQIAFNLKTLAASWLPHLGAGPERLEDGTPLGLAVGSVRALVAVALTLAPLAVAIGLRKTDCRSRRATLAAFLAGLLPVLLINITLMVPDLRGLGVRFFYIPLFLLFSLTGLAMDTALARGGRRASATRWILVALAFGLAVGTWTRFVPGVARLDALSLELPATPNLELVEILDDLGRDCGYATYWNAGITTVLADSRVKVWPIRLHPDRVVPFPMLVSRRWYQADACPGPTFLVLQGKEYRSLGSGLKTWLEEPSIQKMSRGPWVVFLLDDVDDLRLPVVPAQHHGAPLKPE
jgi:hypothetical protein